MLIVALPPRRLPNRRLAWCLMLRMVVALLRAALQPGLAGVRGAIEARASASPSIGPAPEVAIAPVACTAITSVIRLTRRPLLPAVGNIPA